LKLLHFKECLITTLALQLSKFRESQIS